MVENATIFQENANVNPVGKVQIALHLAQKVLTDRTVFTIVYAKTAKAAGRTMVFAFV